MSATIGIRKGVADMRAKRTATNQVTLPDSLVTQLGDPEAFEVTVEDGRIVLTPVQPQSADTVRRKLAELGIDEADIDDAVGWARVRE
jgi:antitoxin component of MazEF toxin-antitoxin module